MRTLRLLFVVLIALVANDRADHAIIERSMSGLKPPRRPTAFLSLLAPPLIPLPPPPPPPVDPLGPAP